MIFVGENHSVLILHTQGIINYYGIIAWKEKKKYYSIITFTVQELDSTHLTQLSQVDLNGTSWTTLTRSVEKSLKLSQVLDLDDFPGLRESQVLEIWLYCTQD